jgi:Tfp pilus assembly protein FimT
MAIMGLMLVLVVPVTSALRGAGSVNDATLNIALILEQARSYAMANNTYVWVGFTDGTSNGTPRVVVSAVAGTSGLASDISSSATYRPVIKVKSFENVRIQPEVSPALAGREIADNVSDSSIGTFTQRVANTDTQFRQVIQFDPKGSARIKASQSRWIEMGLQPSQSSASANENVTAFQIAGLTGQVNVLRP